METADAVAQAIDNLEPGSVLTRFVLVAEVIDSDGNRQIWTDQHDGANDADVYGLLQVAWEIQNAEHATRLFGGGDPDA